MTVRQAESEGLHFTGMCFRKWDTENKESYKQRVEDIKKKYKVRLVLVTDGDFQHYYSDSNYIALMHHNENGMKLLEQQAVRLKEKYEDDLKVLEQDKLRWQKVEDLRLSLLK